MAKISQKNLQKNSANSTTNNKCTSQVKKRTRKTVPRDAPVQRSSIYRGVTRHRWTGRYEAHLWDKDCWNEAQNKKGRQVYLGAYDDEEAAARAYDLAALKYWGQETILNFPVSMYEEELKEMEGHSREKFIGSLRRQSSGFSRGVSKYRGVARHHHNGRWEARIGRVLGNKYLYLGTYATQEEAATAYDMAAIEYRGLNAVTNFDLSRYIKWLRPDYQNSLDNPIENQPNPNDNTTHEIPTSNSELEMLSHLSHHTCSSGGRIMPRFGDCTGSTPSALGLLLQSSKFKEMLERSKSEAASPSTPSLTEYSSDRSRGIFPDDIQTYFDYQDCGTYIEGDETIFGDFNSFDSSTIFRSELDS